MKLRNEFIVAAPLERTWIALLDVPRVASALPGATIEPGGNGEHRGRMKVKIGPVTAEYAGTARLEDVDEDAHVASFYVQGSGEQGAAAATITNRVEEVEGGTRVVVETDLRVTGRAAAFGRGLLEDVSARLLAEFARRLEAEILEPSSRSITSSVPAPEDALDLGAAAWEPLIRRYALPALLVVFVLLLLRRPKVVVIRKP
ncbi:MAG TPA: SRPBCC family protein [Gaiellaceae bacterium]|nr:SRPBCC family protein [Gaiellaceae bacterium]